MATATSSCRTSRRSRIEELSTLHRRRRRDAPSPATVPYDQDVRHQSDKREKEELRQIGLKLEANQYVLSYHGTVVLQILH
jgi:hypothetical protein